MNYLKELVFERGCHKTKTRQGKEARIIMNDFNIKKQYYQVVIDGKTMTTRCGIAKALEIINHN